MAKNKSHRQNSSKLQSVRLPIISRMYCLYGYPVILVDNIQDLRALLGPEILQHNLYFGFRNPHRRYGQWKICVEVV